MPSSIPELSQLISRCILHQHFRSLRCGHKKAYKPLQLLGLMVMLLLSWKPLLAQLVPVNGPINLPATNVASSSAPQNILLKTTSAETITSFTVPVSQGNKQEYTVGMVTGCAVDGTTSNAAGTICTVPITFSPAYPGRRPVPLQAVTSAGNINVGLNGIGVGPLAALTPGIITTIAGTGTSSYTGDGGPAIAASMYQPEGIALDNAGNVYFSDSINNVVRKIDAASGVITTVAGNAAANPSIGVGGFSGDGGPATSAQLYRPNGVSFDSAGNLYIADGANIRVRRVDAATGIITTVAGNGTNTHTGDGGLAVNAGFRTITDVKFDSKNNMYIAEGTDIRRVDAVSGIATTIAGSGPGGDGVPAINSYVYPFALVFDSQDNLYFTEPTQNRVRVITSADGYVNTVAGTGTPGYVHSGDGGPATSASLDEPNFVTVDSADDIYITESAGNYIRMVTAGSQIISTIAGLGLDSTGVPGDGGPATAATVSEPTGITLDGSGNLYISSYVAERIRKINVSQSALIWPTTTNVGDSDSSDDPETAILTDIGNFQMSVPFATSPSDPVITNGWLLDSASTCSPNGFKPLTLNSGQACTLPVDFTPTAPGTNNGTLVLTDNSLNIPTSTQTITLTGTGAGVAAVAQAVLSPSSLTFTTNATTAGANQLVTLSNPGSAPLNISSIAITGANASAFVIKVTSCGSTLAANASCVINIGFPASTVGTYNATLTVTDNASPTVQTASLTGTVTGSVQVTVTPSALNFTTTPGLTPAPQVVTITNSGAAVLSLGLIAVSGNNSVAFSPVGTCNSSLAVGASCTVTITFIGTTAGSYAATLTVNDNASPGMQTVILTGTVTTGALGVPIATLTPTSLTYTATTGTTSAVQTTTLTNSGTAALSIASFGISGANSSSFLQGASTCGSSLAAGASCTIAVTFAPSSAGTFTATLSVTDAVGTQTSALSGTGVVFSTPADFTIAATPAVQSSYRGATLSYAVQLTSADPNNPFTSTVALTAVGLPEGTSVSFSPGSVVPGTTQAATSTMTVTIPAVSGRSSPPTSPFPLNSVPAAVSLASLGFIWFSRRRWKQRPLLMVLLAFAALASATALTGCSGTKTGFAVPTSTSIITVTGTSGSTTHSTTVTLTIQ